MFNVIVTEKGGDQKRLEFDKPEITIGRVQGNDIILPKGNVSKRHSRIVLKDGKFIIVDLKSTNGTYVNGRKITSPLVIKETDKIYIGDFIITVEEPNGAAASPGGLDAGPPPGPPPPAPPPPPQKRTAPPPAPVPVARAAPPAPPPPMSPPEPDELPPVDEPRAAPPPPVGRSTGSAAPLGAVAAPPPAPSGRGTLPPPMGGRDPLAARSAAVGAPAPSSRSSGAVPAVEPSPREASAPPVPRATPAPAPAPVPAPAPAPAPPPRLVGAGAAAAAAPAAIAPIAPVPVVPIVAAPPPAAAPDPKRQKATELQREIHDKLAAQLELARMPIERLAEESLWQRAESVICDLVDQMNADGKIPQFVDQDALIKDTLNETLGLGPLEDLLADEAVSDIIVSRHDRVVFEKAGRLELSDKSFSSEIAVRQVIDRLVAPTGRKIDAAAPVAELRLPDGSRLTAAIPPVAARGACLTLRKPRAGVVGLEELLRVGALSKQMADFLGVCAAARRNVVVCGAPGSGKVQLLGALANLAAAGERVVSVEDVAELSLGRDAWVALEGRLPDLDGRGGVTKLDLVRVALHMRPDRVIVSDVAGAEAYELLLAMASAHEGSMISVAADGGVAALSRLELLSRLGCGGSAGAGAGRGVKELVAGAAHVVVHIARYADGVPRVTGICEVTGVRGDDYELRELFQFQPQGRGPDGVIRGRFAGLGHIPRFYESLEARGIPADPSVFK